MRNGAASSSSSRPLRRSAPKEWHASHATQSTNRALIPKPQHQIGVRDLARRHGSKELDIGADLYDLWLDSLLEAVRVCDPACTPAVEQAWEKVMGIGIAYLTTRYRA